MKRIAVIAHPDKSEASEASRLLEKLAGERSLEVVGETEKPDLIAALGGDGTILKAAIAAHRLDVPLLGVNLGRLGFLSAVERSELGDALDAIAKGDFRVENRLILEARQPQGPALLALNEVVVAREDPARIVRVAVSAGGGRVATYVADAFIVATPSGSTAYSFSAGGPVVDPGLEALILTPVSPHSPLMRSSLVISASHPVDITILEGRAHLIADGEISKPIETGGQLTVGKHERSLKLVLLESSRTFLQKLRARFGLAEGPSDG